MTCRDVAETSLSDLAGLAQYCSRRARLQLLKQHSSTIPRFWERRLFVLLVGRPAGIKMKTMSSRHFSIVLVTCQTNVLNSVINLLTLNSKPAFQTFILSMQWKSLGPNAFLDSTDFCWMESSTEKKKDIQLWKDIRESKCWQILLLLGQLVKFGEELYDQLTLLKNPG